MSIEFSTNSPSDRATFSVIDKEGIENFLDIPKQNFVYVNSMLGLKTLNAYSPGTIDKLINYHKNPAHANIQSIISDINTIKPGLYEKLRDLSRAQVADVQPFRLVFDGLRDKITYYSG